MNDRIQIDGTWYVKEDTKHTETFTKEKADVLLTHSALVETGTSCFEYIVPVTEDGTVEQEYGYLVYTDKRVPRDEWTEEDWDNLEWLKDLRDDSLLRDDILTITHNDKRQVRHLLETVTTKGLMCK